MRRDLYRSSDRDLVCIGKVVPNIIRNQDNLIFELMMPSALELTIEQDLEKAARILAPFLILSHHVVFNLDEMELDSALHQSINMLL